MSMLALAQNGTGASPARAVPGAGPNQNPNAQPLPAIVAPTRWPQELRYHFDFVKAYMRQKGPLGSVGWGTLAGMGDEAAFHVYAVMIQRPPLSVDETLVALDIVHSSFAKPELVRDPTYLQPLKTLELFKIIEATAVDDRVKSRIAHERMFLQTVPKSVVHRPMQRAGERDVSAGGALPTQGDVNRLAPTAAPRQ